MKVTVEELQSGVCRIQFDGRLDMAGVEMAEGPFNEVLAAEPATVVVDLSRVSFISSVGLRLLMTSGKTLAKRGARLILLNPDEMACKVLKSTGIDKVLPVFDSLEAALRSLP